MVIEETNAGAAAQAHPSGIAQDKIDNIMSGISNTGAVKLNNHRKKLRQRFDIIKKLGQGTYGKVQLGINKETGQEVAIKTIKKCKIEAEADLIRIRREVQIMSSVQHPNIIHIYEVFENREKMVLVMEFAAGGELYDYLSERKVLAEEEARRVFRQVSTAVYYCHKHKICHRDLKLENILLDENGNAKIADFGLSNVFEDQRLLATFCGSPLYASPEIVKGTPYLGPEVDCWSLGVLLYTLVYGSMPFDGSNFKRLVKQISQGDYYEPKKPSRASPLIRDMLTVCPEKRADIEQICRHWWVNEGYEESCLELAEALANQTPVRLDVLLSLSPMSVTADQLVVPSGEINKSNERVSRSHSVGSIRCLVNTAAERRILDMVAAGGEEALMPSPTRNITPIQSPPQIKRKIEGPLATESSAEIAKKKERPTEKQEPMEVELVLDNNYSKNMEDKTSSAQVSNLSPVLAPIETTKRESFNSIAKINEDNEKEQTTESSNVSKVLKKAVSKHKTADMISAIKKLSPEIKPSVYQYSQPSTIRKNSLLEESYNKITPEPIRSKIFETVEKFQNNNENQPKYIPGMNVSNFKKKFERKSSLPAVGTDRKLSELSEIHEAAIVNSKSSCLSDITAKELFAEVPKSPQKKTSSGNSIENFSLEEARRSMENSIALLNQARDESSKHVDMLCAKTENIAFSNVKSERERKLQNAREIIGNAIQPGVRKLPFTPKTYEYSPAVNNHLYNLRVRPSDYSTPFYDRQPLKEPMMTTSFKRTPPIVENNAGNIKTSKAEITLKSATLPRRKVSKAEIKLEIEPKITEHPIRYSTEMQHKMPDIMSAPIDEDRPNAFKSNSSLFHQRATSLGPSENLITTQKPPMYMKQQYNPFKFGSSFNQFETTPKNLQSASSIASQPIKKSPREFIIPIAVEGGGFITPKPGSFESSGSSIASTTNSNFSKMRQPRLVSSLFNETEPEENSALQKLRGTSITEADETEPRFSFHRLRSSRPMKKNSQDYESQSSGEEEDDDGFEILTAENLFSTLLQRVKALTNRLNVNNDVKPGFPNSSRLLNSMRKTPFWTEEPFERRINESIGAPWRRSLSRDLENDFDTIFSRTGATLPRGNKNAKNPQKKTHKSSSNNNNLNNQTQPPLDLADLDLSRLHLSKKDFETLSCITPGLPKCFQEQLIAKLPVSHARKLSRTLSMQNNIKESSSAVFKTSQSKSRDFYDNNQNCITMRNISPVKCKEIKSQEIPTDEIFDTNNLFDYDNANKLRNDSKYFNSPKFQYYAKPPTIHRKLNETQKSNGASSNESEKELENFTNNVKDSHKRPPSGYLSPPTSFSSLISKPLISNKNGLGTKKDLVDNLKLRMNPKEIHKNSKLSKSVEIDWKMLQDRQTNLSKSYNVTDYSSSRLDDKLSIRFKQGEKKHSDRNENITENYSEENPKIKTTDRLTNSNIDLNSKLSTNSMASKDNITESKSISHIEILQIMQDVKKNKESKLKRPKSYPNKSPKTYAIISSQNTSEPNSSLKSNQIEIDADKNYEMILRRQNHSNKAIIDSSIQTKNIPNEPIITAQKPLKSLVSDIRNNLTSDDCLEENSMNLLKTQNSKIGSTDKKKEVKNKGLQTVEESTEKKSGKGLFFAISKKLDKLRENSKNGSKKKLLLSDNTTADSSNTKISLEQNIDSNKKTNEFLRNNNKSEILSKLDKEFLIYSMENEDPTNNNITESGLLKKAVSVGEIPNSFDKCGVKKVLAFFKKFEKDGGNTQKVLSTRSTSNIDSRTNLNFNKKQKSKSNKIQFLKDLTDSKTNKNLKSKTFENNEIELNSNNQIDAFISSNNKIKDFYESDETYEKKIIKIPQKKNLPEIKSIKLIKNDDNNYYININRLKKFDTLNGNNFDDLRKMPKEDNFDCNKNQSKISATNERYSTNSLKNSKYSVNDYALSVQNSLASLNDNSSNSTILAHDDSEINFENLSICSEDAQGTADNDPSPLLSRLSRTSQNSGSTNADNQNESMMDRIKRRSFYCRFNDNKPKRQSNIVGAAAREYYRETEAKLRSRPRERISSLCTVNYRPEIEYTRQAKVSSPENDFKTSPLSREHSKSAMSSSLLIKSNQSIRNDNLTLPRNRGHNIYNTYDSNCTYYNPIQNPSYILNEVVPPLCSNNTIDGYPTLGRRSMRSYDHRTSSLFDYTQNSGSRPVSSTTKRQVRTPSLNTRHKLPFSST